MERRFENDLKNIKARILAMGGFVEQSIEMAVQALLKRDPSVMDGIREIEKKINEEHVAIDHACFALLARQAPVAADLRLLLAIIKINTDLERMGDQALNISFNTEFYMKDASISAPPEIAEMARVVRSMVRDSLDSFMREDTVLAQNVLERDDEVDTYKDEMFDKLKNMIKQNPNLTEAALDLILICRNLERMGDHATNIGEDVIFAFTGEDVRHGTFGFST